VATWEIRGREDHKANSRPDGAGAKTHRPCPQSGFGRVLAGDVQGLQRGSPPGGVRLVPGGSAGCWRLTEGGLQRRVGRWVCVGNTPTPGTKATGFVVIACCARVVVNGITRPPLMGRRRKP